MLFRVIICLALLGLGMVFCTDDQFLDIIERERVAGQPVFPNTHLEPYWTSTNWWGFGYGVFFDFIDGAVNAVSDPDRKYYVRCVTNIDPDDDYHTSHTVYFNISRSGQRKSYVVGDDGYYRSNLPEMTFQDNGNSTISDMTTGLLWTKCTLGQFYQTDVSDNCKGTHEKYTWSEAIQACDELEFAGRSDWRLPIFSELSSLIDYGTANPAIK